MSYFLAFYSFSYNIYWKNPQYNIADGSELKKDTKSQQKMSLPAATSITGKDHNITEVCLSFVQYM